MNAILNLNINTAFMSAGGVNISRGVSCSNPHEVDIKQAVLKTAANKILVVDSTKFNVIKPMLFAKLEQFDMICTDPKCDPELATKTGCPLMTQ